MTNRIYGRFALAAIVLCIGSVLITEQPLRMNTAERILSLFRGRSDTIAVGNGPAFQPQPIDGPIKPSWIRKEHLSGKRCLGFYLMTEESQVYCSAVDFDNKPDAPDPEWQDKTETVYYYLTQLGLSPVVEISQSGHAAHVWLFFDEPVDAWLVRQFWSIVSEKCEVQFVEVYPRQDELSGKKLGNLIRFPLWKESRFADVENEWAAIDADTAMSDARKVEATTIRTLCYQLSGKTPAKLEQGIAETGLPARVDRLVSRSNTLLGRRWQGDMTGLNDRSRSALVLSIATELVRLYVPTPEIEQSLRLWCSQNEYDKGDRDDWVASTVSKAYEFTRSKNEEKHSTTITMRDAIHMHLDKIASGRTTCIGSGVEELDRSIDGIAPGEICVIAARPSHGKTAFAMQWIDHASECGMPCLLISEEMSASELGKRALLSITHLSEEVWTENRKDIDAVVDDHHRRRTILVAESCQTIDEVERQIDEQCSLNDVQLVAVDYLQLLGSNHNSRYDSVTEISRRLKQSATRNDVAMIVLCQLNREVEKRDGFEPRLSDLRESGQIEQDADLVLMLQWPTRHDKSANENAYRIFCAKRRNGPIRTPVVLTEFDASRQRFGLPELPEEWNPAPGEYGELFS